MDNHDDHDDILDELLADVDACDRHERQEKLNKWLVREVRSLRSWVRTALIAASVIAALVMFFAGAVGLLCAMGWQPLSTHSTEEK